MTLLVDAAPLVALADDSEPRRGQILDCLRREDGPLVIPAPITAEVDYLLGRRFGSRAQRAFLADLAAGRFMVSALEPEEYMTVLTLEDRYAGLDLGLADCSLVILAARYETTRLLTFDERQFRTVGPLRGGETFTILPSDL
ncbi:MAG: PIN domain-containing protein [Solirubrobacterales bacterium]|nr:PIN domain-containing protein [Solirubrobacterales bacterium]